MPNISLLIPVHNGGATLERALRSLLVQSFPTWEAIIIDDASTDSTVEIAQAWNVRDARLRLTHLYENRGSAAARNAGLRMARGEFLAYLDADDELYPDYLERVAALRDSADVLVFGFDFVYEDGPRGDRPESWDPTAAGRDFFSFNPAVTLATAHRRSLIERAGRFNEMVWLQEDWDLWKRMARAGAKFSFVSAKSGAYHIRAGTQSKSARLTAPQREAVLANWHAGRPIFAPAANGVDSGEPARARKRPVRTVAFISPHCPLDANREAARAALGGLQLLADNGFECQGFCGTHFDSAQEVLVEQVLAQRGHRYQVRNAQVGPYRARMIFAALGKVGLTLFNTVSTRGLWRDEAEIAAFLTACDIFLNKQRPDAVWAYGLDPVSFEMRRLAMRLDIPIVLSVDDADYADDSVFQRADYAIVPSEEARQFHWQRIGLASLVMPPVVDQAQAESLAPIYRHFFSRITHQPGPPLVPPDVARP